MELASKAKIMETLKRAQDQAHEIATEYFCRLNAENPNCHPNINATRKRLSDLLDDLMIHIHTEDEKEIFVGRYFYCETAMLHVGIIAFDIPEVRVFVTDHHRWGREY